MEFVAGVWENIIVGNPVANLYAGVPAPGQFSLSSPRLLPRLRKVGSVRPFTFLTARLLEPSSDLRADRSDLVAFIHPSDDAARAELMRIPRQRSWGSVIESFVRHRDRKYLSDYDGKTVRRNILVRKDHIVGLARRRTASREGSSAHTRPGGGRRGTWIGSLESSSFRRARPVPTDPRAEFSSPERGPALGRNTSRSRFEDFRAGSRGHMTGRNYSRLCGLCYGPKAENDKCPDPVPFLAGRQYFHCFHLHETFVGKLGRQPAV